MANFGQGAPGVRIKLRDQSEINLNVSPNATAGVVGASSRGAFNKILTLTSTVDQDSVLGNGFNKAVFNQGMYAARAVLRNGGFVEYVRPYGEAIVANSTNENELCSDAFVVTYDYDTDATQSILIDHFAATRYQTDGYSDFGSREIYTISEAVLNKANINFTLSQAESTTTGRRIALFSIINEDPTAANRAEDDDDTTADKLVVTTAGHKVAYTVVDVLEYDDAVTPTNAQTFTAIDHAGDTVTFEFTEDGTVTGANIAIDIGTTSDYLSATEIMDNIEIAVKAGLPYHKVTRDGYTLTVEAYFGIEDAYNSSTQNKVFTESLTYLTIVSSTVTESEVLLDAGLGRNFLNLGLATEVYVKDTYSDASYTRHFKLNSTGEEVAKIYVTVSYTFDGTVYTFAGTLIPYVHNDINLYIKESAESVQTGFKFLINEHEDLEAATEETDFDLGASVYATMVRVATTANIALSGLITVDGVSLSAGNRVLVKNQTLTVNNGIYVVASGAWTRSTDFNSADEFTPSMYVRVTAGTANADTSWSLTTTGTIYLGSTALAFATNTDGLPVTSTFSKLAYSSTDAAVVNNAIWTYSPKNNKTSAIYAAAWLLFQDKDAAGSDFLVAAGTDITGLFVRNSEELDFNVIDTMLDVCEKRKDMFALFDGVDEHNVDIVLRKMAGVGSSGEKSRWGSIFDGRSKFFDRTYTKLTVEAVKSIELAAMITENRRGGLFWLPPAGKDYGTIPAALATSQKYIRSYNYSEDTTSDIARLYDAQVNPTRVTNFEQIIYGQKTMLKRSTALNRLNVIMLVAGLHKKFERFLDGKVFQLNTSALRSSITSALNAELNKIKSANPPGLTSGVIICDDSNNPRDIIDSNQLIVDMLLQPSRTGEFITLRTTVQRTGDELSIASVQVI